MNKTAILITAFLVLLSCKGDNSELVTPQQFYDEVNDTEVQLIDVRTPEEYREGHIEGAKNINIHDEDFEQQIEQLDKDETVYIYCKSGSRSSSAVNTMKELEFTDITELRGGITAWKEAGKPVVQ